MTGKHKYSPGKTGTIVDTLHIFICVGVCIMAALAFINPAKYSFLFPLIFLLASVLSAVTGWYTLTSFRRNTKKRTESIVYFVIFVLLGVLFIVSAISIWFHN